ncbi:MAG: ribonuclease HII [Chloroflexi bacterium]|nr:ribonuclease HII [Chloroflexota bacterium]
MITPTLDTELTLFGQGYRLIAGLDEVGRGSWAGPVMAAAVALPLERQGLLEDLAGVRDSKQLAPRQRERLLPLIRRAALAIGIGSVPAAEIDRIGIVPATRQAMALALADLSLQPDYLLIDALRLPAIRLPQYALPKGDAKCLCIAAASIVAKVARDQLMVAEEARYPGYGFAAHKGYGTAQHRAALAQLGPCPIHRLSFAPLREQNETLTVFRDR